MCFLIGKIVLDRHACPEGEMICSGFENDDPLLRYPFLCETVRKPSLANDLRRYKLLATYERYGGERTNHSAGGLRAY